MIPRHGALLAVLFALAPAAAAQTPGASGGAQPVGEPQAGEVLRDREFGVSTRAFGLQRDVEMFQWRRTPYGYVQEWSAGVIASDAFDPAYRNPDEMPLPGRIWWSRQVTLDGRPVSPDVLRAFGEWRSFRPSFSRLPANLAATFQPDGDGLSSAENPLRPQIGDLRITWRRLHLPPLRGKVTLRDGVWVPVPTPEAVPAAASSLPADAPEPAGWRWRGWYWFPLALLAFGGAMALRRGRGRRP